MELALPDISLTLEEDLQLLGAPLYPTGLKKCHESKKVELDRLSSLTSQEALLLLRCSLFTPRLIYTLRTNNCAQEPEILVEIDSLLRTSLQSILNTEFTERAFQKASLPARAGGLGVRTTCDLQLPCFLSSLHGTRERVQRLLASDVFEVFTMLLQDTTDLFPILGTAPDFDLSRQRDIDEVLWQEKYSDLLENCTSCSETACMLSAKERLSYKWLSAIPSPNVGNCLDDESVRIAVGLRLGQPICLSHPCSLCKKIVEQNGHHGLHCHRSKGRSIRHTLLNNEISKVLQLVKTPTLREPSGTHIDPFLRPDGISLTPWEKGKYLAWDVTVADTVAPCYVAGTSRRAGHAADTLEARKRRKYAGLLPQYSFVAVGLETLGSMGKGAQEFFNAISRKLSLQQLDERSNEYFLQRVSLILARTNAVCVLGTMQTKNA